MARINETQVSADVSELIRDPDQTRTGKAYLSMIVALEFIALGYADTGKIRDRGRYAADTLHRLAGETRGGGA